MIGRNGLQAERAVPDAAIVQAGPHQLFAADLPSEQHGEQQRSGTSDHQPRSVHALAPACEPVAPGRERTRERQRGRRMHAACNGACQAIGRRRTRAP